MIVSLDEKNISNPTVRKLLQCHYDTIEYFFNKISDIVAEMEKTVIDDPVILQLWQQPGIGFITAVTMRALIGHFDRFRTGK